MNLYEKGLLVMIGLTVLIVIAAWLLPQGKPESPWLWPENRVKM